MSEAESCGSLLGYSAVCHHKLRPFIFPLLSLLLISKGSVENRRTFICLCWSCLLEQPPPDICSEQNSSHFNLTDRKQVLFFVPVFDVFCLLYFRNCTYVYRHFKNFSYDDLKKMKKRKGYPSRFCQS